jgi:hypothetical protein
MHTRTRIAAAGALFSAGVVTYKLVAVATH